MNAAAPTSIRIAVQPYWPQGNAPERISAVRGSFIDGDGVRHAVPPTMPEPVSAVCVPGLGWYWNSTQESRS